MLHVDKELTCKNDFIARQFVILYITRIQTSMNYYYIVFITHIYIYYKCYTYFCVSVQNLNNTMKYLTQQHRQCHDTQSNH